MYSESDLDGAVSAGVLQRDAVAAFRAHVAAARSAPAPDEEHFRLLTGFNDIFVSIAVVLSLASIGWLGGLIWGSLGVAGTAWGLAEYFTSRRRMALPSILLHLAFVLAVGIVVNGWVAVVVGAPATGALPTAAAALAAAVAAALHWRRFQVPITIAILLATGLAAALAVLLALVPQARALTAWLVFGAGVLMFAAAMAWDVSDPLRRTRRSDVAFWLHLLASPLIVHSVFNLTGVTQGQGALQHGANVLVAYVLLAAVALLVDRRALMVSALAYVLVALSSLFKDFGTVQAPLALTTLVVGSALLLLSAMWNRTRSQLLRVVPASWRMRLPLATD